MNPVFAIVNMHFRNKAMWFVVPWATLAGSFVINLIICYIASTETGLYTGGISSIYAVMLVAGVMSMQQTFSFALGLSVRRTDYFLGTLIMAGISSVISAVFLVAFSFIEAATNGWGVRLHFFHLPYLSSGSAGSQFWTFSVLMLYVYFLGLLVSSIHRRFGWMGLLAVALLFLAATSLTSVIITTHNGWGEVFRWFSQHTAPALATYLWPLIACFVLISYVALRRTTP